MFWQYNQHDFKLRGSYMQSIFIFFFIFQLLLFSKLCLSKSPSISTTITGPQIIVNAFIYLMTPNRMNV